MSKAASVLNPRPSRDLAMQSTIHDRVIGSDNPPIDHVPHADPVGDFPQFHAAGRVEPAHQTIAAELFHPVLPELGANEVRHPLIGDGRQTPTDRGGTMIAVSARSKRCC